jgi:hypothetical protein
MNTKEEAQRQMEDFQRTYISSLAARLAELRRPMLAELWTAENCLSTF